MTIVPSGEIDAQADAASAGGQRVAVLAQRLPLKSHKYVTWINAGRRPESYAHDLYTNLRTLDKAGCQRSWCRMCPTASAGLRSATGCCAPRPASPRATITPAPWPCCRKRRARRAARASSIRSSRRRSAAWCSEFGSPLLILDCERVRVQFRKLAHALPQVRSALRAETPAARGGGADRAGGGRLPRSRDQRRGAAGAAPRASRPSAASTRHPDQAPQRHPQRARLRRAHLRRRQSRRGAQIRAPRRRGRSCCCASRSAAPGAVCDLSRKFGCDPEDVLRARAAGGGARHRRARAVLPCRLAGGGRRQARRGHRGVREADGGGAPRAARAASTRSTSAAAFPSTTRSRCRTSAASARRCARRWPSSRAACA